MNMKSTALVIFILIFSGSSFGQNSASDEFFEHEEKLRTEWEDREREAIQDDVNRALDSGGDLSDSDDRNDRLERQLREEREYDRQLKQDIDSRGN